MARAAHHMADYLLTGIPSHLDVDPDHALRLYCEVELGYYTLIDNGLTYLRRQLRQAIDGQEKARAAVQKRHSRVRAGE